ncbi:MAG: ATP-binding protein [Gemmatimonadota bacterium]
MAKPTRVTAIAAWVAVYATLVLGLLWSRHVETPYLVAGLATWAGTCALLVRARLSRLVSVPLIAAVLVLGLSLIVQSYAAWRIARIGEDWPQLLADRHVNMQAMLSRRIGSVVDDATQTAARAATISATHDTMQIFGGFAALRGGSKVDAIALFGEAGDLVAWAGEHRAKLAQNVRLGTSGPTFVEQPLYSYLYIPTRVEGTRSHVVSMVLLATAIHEHAHDVSDRSIAHVTSHLGAVFRSGKGPPDAWPLVVNGDTIAHARLAPITQSDYRDEAIALEQRAICVLAAIALVLLTVAWLRRPNLRFGTTVPLLGAAGALAVAPLRAFGLEELFSPALFLLPLPAEISLGTLLSILLALGALAASVHDKVRIPRWPTVLVVLGGMAVIFAYPGAIRLLVGPGASAASDAVRASGTQLLLGGPALWFGLQIAAVLLLGVVTELALPRWHWFAQLEGSKLRTPWVLMLVGSLATSGALSLLILLLSQTKQSVSPWLAAAWVLPFLLAAFALAGYRGAGLRLIRWLTAGWLATTAVLPYLWIAHVDERLAGAERQVSTLGANPDPFLDYLLMQFAREARVRAQSGETGYLLLYRSWAASGLARESYPARLTIWSNEGLPEVPLPLGNIVDNVSGRSQTLPPYLEAAFARARENRDSVELMRVQGIPNVNEALILALGPDHLLTVEVPPRRSLEHRDIPFLATDTDEDVQVELVRPRPGVSMPQMWQPAEDGWRYEKPVMFADGEYHAHVEVRVPGIGVRVARGVLMLALNLLLFTFLWLLGRAARGEHLQLRAAWRGWRGSFRARVTATLFFFFLIPTAVFGWVAFGALAREVTRATRIVAEHAVRQAVVEFQETAGDLRELAAHAGSDVLYYFAGELTGASSPEALDLGVYGAWMPSEIFLALTRQNEDAAVATRPIAGQQVLTAYRSLMPAGTLAVPMSLESGETAVRQRELAHLILFAALMGGLLSLLLSVVVGRALTGPIGMLQRAAALVGAGNLRVRMPEHTGDEFGQLFETFNRMVRRLRRARTQEIRTARVLAWGEMARQVAHEIKNPLTPIKLAVQHLTRAHADRKPNFGEVLDENVEQILLEIDRLSEIARAFSRYGAPQASIGPLEPVNVRQVIHEALTLYRAGDPDVEYRDEIEPDVANALGRSGELKEVLLNLLENARAALDGAGGRIQVSARTTDDARIEIAVTDNGPGIPTDFLPRVFEPHFSTRSAGTGLGLAIVRRLVESWDGSVTAESELGAGTTIRVTLRQA